MSFIADDLGAWLVALLADSGRKRLVTWVLGTEQERALRQAATAAIGLVAGELRPEGGDSAEELALVVSQVFTDPVPAASAGAQATLLEALQAGIARQLAVLDDVGLTGTGRSSAQVLGWPATVLAGRLTGYLVREIVARGSRGGPLEPLAAQLNHDVTHLQGKRLEDVVGQLAGEVRDALSRLDSSKMVPSSSFQVRYSLPPDAAAFTGRDEELDRIVAAVGEAAGAGAGGVVAIHAIGGMPGVGKTTLAVHAAHVLRHRFPDRQLFINLRAHTPGQDPLTPEAALAVLLSAAGMDARLLPEDLEGRAALWRDRMATQRSIIVLDNAASSAQVAPLLPGSESCLVLLTSRRHLGDLPGTVAPVMLEVLPPGKAREMFLRLAPRAVADRAAVAELVQLAGFLPLAISLLARVYARHPSWTVSDLTDETRASMLTLAAEKDTVAAAFDVSYRYLPPGLQRFFRCLGLHLGTMIDAYAAAALAGTGLQEAIGQLDALHREGLVIETGYRRYGMHDLIRRYARGHAAADAAPEREQAVERLLDYYLYTADLAETWLARQTRTSPACLLAPPATVPALPDRAHALAWARTERPNLLACLDYATRTGQHARIIALTAALAALLQQDGPWTEAAARHATAVQAARHLGDRLGEANALSNLGMVRYVTDEFRGAAQPLEEALGIFRDLGNRLGQANTLSNLGAVRYMAEDNFGAEEALEEALAISRDLGDRTGQALALCDLGTVSRSACKYQEAAHALEEALQISRDLGDGPGQALALTHLGILRTEVGDYPGAAQVLGEALGISRDLGDRLFEANALIFLGTGRRMSGDYRAAADLLEKGLDISRDLGERLCLANALTYLGAVRRETGDYPGAVNALQEALSIYRRFGFRGPLAEALNETGILHRVFGDLSQARDYHQQALRLAREIHSVWDEAHALAGLGRCALLDDRAAEAAANLRQAQEIFQRIGAAEANVISGELATLTRDHPGT